MGYFDYSREPQSDIAFIDMKSFYASVECVERGLHPLKTSLCVMSRADNSNGLILASSPMFKRVFGKQNVGRVYDLPFDIHTRKFSYYNAKRQGIEITPEYVRYIEEWAKVTFIVPPRMSLYIEKNIEIQRILQNYGSPEDILPYSIDEGFIDLTGSLNYFIPSKTLSRKEKLDILSSKIQHDIFRRTGVYSTVGMSNSNPLLAKLALDNEAKKTKTMRANWSYEDVETKVWGIKEMTDFWGIGVRMKKRLNDLGIGSIKELANSNPDMLKTHLGINGVDLFFHANGIDESNVHKPYKPKSTGIGNSQVLPRDYIKQREIEIVLSEMAEQVAVRLRKDGKKTTCVSIGVGYSRSENKKSIHAQVKVEPTNQTELLKNHVLALFHKKYSAGAVRNISVYYSQLVDDFFGLISLFDNVEQIEKEERLQSAIDTIRQQFGFTALLKANALTDGSRVIARSQLVGGHSAGGLDGLN
ncbi:Y-family DNA polymerase [Streptococcus agalactiae]|uniref:Y-family DNA polymerase n=1 Tax=Streptococcus agalactiae TaxID=1311 RepID=UPI0002BAF557|nr:Y-family DNA polymerase [Streptococcus agalactiae]EPT37234.1 DNA-directed DNA polymerase [Streptococcus agalactiae FSL C1-494]EPT43347.1 DNA-directed DNA polymerase [Streptococcus agalactiae FSL S3-170]EPV86514.1 DNA-directed DNA polymerase [Streptococcus agalactiae FSL C1-487]KLL29995.1 DNA polymerase [Streptococcus agalactiae]KLL82753.1 DNA polymerase [Streptococcus agalactiae]